MLGKIFTLIIGVGIGILIVMYNRWLVRTVGMNSWAERTFGGGGTYTMWQLIGVVVIIGTVLYVTGTLDTVFVGLARMIGL